MFGDLARSILVAYGLFCLSAAYDGPALATEAESLIAKSEQGDLQSQERLGSYLLFGVTFKDGSKVEKNVKSAEKLLTAAATSGSLGAQLGLGFLYFEGAEDNSHQTIDKDYWLANKWLITGLTRLRPEFEKQSEAERNEAGAIDKLRLLEGELALRIALTYMQECVRREDHLPELECTKRLGEFGNAYALENPSKAVDWFKQSEKKGNTTAAYWLGLAYERGSGVPQDYTVASEWYQKAAFAKQNEMALTALGNLAEKMSDLVSAHMWFNLAGDQWRRNSIAGRLKPGEVVRAQQMATAWASKMSEKKSD